MTAREVELAPRARTPLQRVVYIARRAWSMEMGVWKSLYRLVTVRPRVPRGARPFTYDKQSRTILIAFIVLSAIEIPIIDLIVHPWPWLRWPLLIVGIWGLTFMVGLLLGFITRPHSVGPDGLRFRNGPEFELVLDWDEDVVSVARRRHRTESGRSYVLTARGDDLILSLPQNNETNVVVVLERPTLVRINFDTHRVTELRVWLDDVDAYLDAVRSHLIPSER